MDVIEGWTDGINVGATEVDGMEETLGADDGMSGKDISPPPHQQQASKGWMS